MRTGNIYAMKVEKRHPKRDHFKLIIEEQVLRDARARQYNGRHFPELFDSWRKADRMWIAMTLLGQSLEDIKNRQPSRTFRSVLLFNAFGRSVDEFNTFCLSPFCSPNTAFYCAVQTLEAIQQLHDLGYVHRDIKPSNFVIGRRETPDFNTIYIVDFGIARKYVDDRGRVKTPREQVGVFLDLDA